MSRHVLQGVLLAAAAKTALAVMDAGSGSVLAALDSAGLVTHGAALSADGRLFAAATFTADVKVGRPGCRTLAPASPIILTMKVQGRHAVFALYPSDRFACICQ